MLNVDYGTMTMSEKVIAVKAVGFFKTAFWLWYNKNSDRVILSFLMGIVKIKIKHFYPVFVEIFGEPFLV